MTVSLAFDVYGTLLDPMGVTEKLTTFVGDDAAAFSAAWRSKQVEYLFRRGLGRKYQPFTVCTRQALDFTCLASGHELDEQQREALMAEYLRLPAFEDTVEALAELRRRGFDLYAFSNGEPDALAEVLANAGLSDFFRGIISVHEVRSFKPDPSVYAFFLENTGAALGRTWLVSANPFDVIGALEVGWKAAWLRRDPAMVFDPWGIEPTATVDELSSLTGVLSLPADHG
jgi:2-haloacid dehalogenase